MCCKMFKNCCSLQPNIESSTLFFVLYLIWRHWPDSAPPLQQPPNSGRRPASPILSLWFFPEEAAGAIILIFSSERLCYQHSHHITLRFLSITWKPHDEMKVCARKSSSRARVWLSPRNNLSCARRLAGHDAANGQQLWTTAVLSLFFFFLPLQDESRQTVFFC